MALPLGGGGGVNPHYTYAVTPTRSAIGATAPERLTHTSSSHHGHTQSLSSVFAASAAAATAPSPFSSGGAHHHHSASTPSASLAPAGLPSSHPSLHAEKEHFALLLAGDGGRSNVRSSHYVARHMHVRGSMASPAHASCTSSSGAGATASGGGNKKMSLRKVQRDSSSLHSPALGVSTVGVPAALTVAPSPTNSEPASSPCSPVKRARLNPGPSGSTRASLRLSNLGSGGGGGGGGDGTAAALLGSSTRARKHINFNVSPHKQLTSSSRATSAFTGALSPSAATATPSTMDGSSYVQSLQAMRQQLLVFLDACSHGSSEPSCAARAGALQAETLQLFHKLLLMEHERASGIRGTANVAVEAAATPRMLSPARCASPAAAAPASASSAVVAATPAATAASNTDSTTIAPPPVLDGNMKSPLPAGASSFHASTMPFPSGPIVHTVYAPLRHMADEHEGMSVVVEHQFDRSSSSAAAHASALRHLSLPPERGTARSALHWEQQLGDELQEELHMSEMVVTEMALPPPSSYEGEDGEEDRVHWGSARRRTGKCSSIVQLHESLDESITGTHGNHGAGSSVEFTVLPLPSASTEDDGIDDDDGENIAPAHSLRLPGQATSRRGGRGSFLSNPSPCVKKSIQLREVSANRNSFSVSSHNGDIEAGPTAVYRMEHEDYSTLRQPLSPLEGTANGRKSIQLRAVNSQPTTPRGAGGENMHSTMEKNLSSPSAVKAETQPSSGSLHASPTRSPMLLARASPPRIMALSPTLRLLSPPTNQALAAAAASGVGSTVAPRSAGPKRHQHKRSASAFASTTLQTLAEHADLGSIGASIPRGEMVAPEMIPSLHLGSSASAATRVSNVREEAPDAAVASSSSSSATAVRSMEQQVSDLFAEGLPMPSSTRPSIAGSSGSFTHAFNSHAVLVDANSPRPTSLTSSHSHSHSSLRRGSKRKSDHALERSSSPVPAASEAGDDDVSARTQLVARDLATAAAGAAAVPVTSAASVPPFSFPQMHALVVRLQKDKVALLAACQSRANQRTELAAYLNHMRMRFMQRPFAVLKFHGKDGGSGALSLSASSAAAPALATPSKWRSLFASPAKTASSSSSALSTSASPSARRWFALSLDGLALWWSKHPTMEQASSLPVAGLVDVSVGLVGVSVEQHDDGDADSMNGGGKHATPSFSLRALMASSSPGALNSASLFALRGKLYAQAVQSFDDARRLYGLGKNGAGTSQHKRQKIEQVRKMKNPLQTIVASDEYEGDENAEEAQAPTADAAIEPVVPSVAAAPTSSAVALPSFFPPALGRFHAAHWRVSFHAQERSLHLLMQTKADLDVWVEFAQRVMIMREAQSQI